MNQETSNKTTPAQRYSIPVSALETNINNDYMIIADSDDEVEPVEINYTKTNYKCHEPSNTFTAPTVIYLGEPMDDDVSIKISIFEKYGI
jgi:hypothetical protein